MSGESEVSFSGRGAKRDFAAADAKRFVTMDTEGKVLEEKSRQEGEGGGDDENNKHKRYTRIKRINHLANEKFRATAKPRV